MPKTTFQRFVFTAIMVFCMVYTMTVYNLAWNAGALHYCTFWLGLQEMWVEYIVVFLLIFFAVSKAAPKLAFRLVTPQSDRPIAVILAIQTFTVLLTVPVVTLFSTLFHGGFSPDWFPQWIMLWLRCLPMAFGVQIFAADPLVRWIFRLLFPEKQAVPAE